MVRKQADREEQRERWNREELVELLGRALPTEGRIRPIPGLILYSFTKTTEAIYGVAETSFCAIAQGSKEICLGEDRYQYDPYHYLLATAEIPVIGRVREATESRPYLALRLTLDPALVGSVLMEMGQTAASLNDDMKALTVSPLDAPLLEVVVRLVRLVEAPAEQRLLASSIIRELVILLLLGPQRHKLVQMTALGGQGHRIGRAIGIIRKQFNKPLPVEDLARRVGISVSVFHNHFKQVTSMSPLQFQKRLRLQEARRLLLSGEFDAASVGFRVGYEDPSQFNREYKWMFTVPPMQDVKRLRRHA